MPLDPQGEFVLLTADEMGRADRLTIEQGSSGEDLMEHAGRAVAEELLSRFRPDKAVVVTGPGNNGGDGFVAARYLADAGITVVIAAMTDPAELSGDARIMAERYQGPILALASDSLDGADAVVDALFGAGLSRPVEGAAADVINRANDLDAFRLAVDIPTGISGDTGKTLGTAFRADSTVTFFRKKPGHLLVPGRFYCGETVVKSIGIKIAALEEIRPGVFENDAALWADKWKPLDPAGHKYDRGHAVIVGGRPPGLGATRLSAMAALRTGAGLVTLATPRSGYGIQATALTEVMVWPFDEEGLAELLSDTRKSVFAFGPGAGRDAWTRGRTIEILSAGKKAVLDADALTAFQDDTARLFDAIRGDVILTPHAGEFARLFGDPGEPSKLEATRIAAQKSGAVIVHKGPDTVIAAPDGRCIIDGRTTPHLATGGTGDVLTGIVAGFLAQGLPAFEAGAAAVWVQGEAASDLGRGMISGDLLSRIPTVLERLEAFAAVHRKAGS